MSVPTTAAPGLNPLHALHRGSDFHRIIKRTKIKQEEARVCQDL